MHTESPRQRGEVPVHLQSIEAWPPPSRKRRRWVPWAAGAILGILFVFALVVTIVSLLVPVRKLPPREAELAERKHIEAREAFAAGSPAGEIPHAILEFFRQFQAATNDSDVEALWDLFDRHRLIAEVKRLRAEGPSVLFDAVSDIEFNEEMNRLSEWPMIDHVEVRRCRNISRSERLVHVRMWTSGGTYKMRWWFCNRRGRWRPFDYEFTMNGLRASDELALVRQVNSAAARSGYTVWMPDDDQVTAWYELKDAIRWENWYEAQQLLASDLSRLPARLVDIVEIWRAATHLELGAAHEAMVCCEQPGRNLAEIPLMWLVKARAQIELGDHRGALQSAERYRSTSGDDARIFHVIALAHLGLGASGEALAWLRQALDEDPDHTAAFTTLAAQLDGAGKREVARRFQAMRWPYQNLVDVGEALLEAGDVDSLEMIIEANKPNLDRDLNLAYYAARTHMARDRFADAAATMERVLDLAGERNDTTVFVDMYLEAMVKSPCWQDAYRRAPDRTYAFDQVGGMLLRGSAWNRLGELIEMRRKEAAEDPNIAYYHAQTLMHESKYVEAADTVFPAIARAPEGETHYFADLYLVSMLKAGEAMAAYQRMDDREYAINYLGNALLEDDRIATLEKILDAHRRFEPVSPWIGYFRGQICFDREQYDDAVRWLESVLDVMPEESQWQAKNLYQRAMVGGGRAIEYYHRADDRRAAFLELAWLVSEDFPEQLDGLVEAHRRQDERDPWLKYFEGESSGLRGDWSAAAEHYRAGRALAELHDQADFRVALVHALEKAGRWRDAYDEIAPKGETLSQLINLTVAAENIAQLEAIRDALLTEMPDTPHLSRVLVEISWFKGEYENVLALLAEHRVRLRDQIVAECDCDELEVRALVKLGRLDEAQRKLEANPDSPSLLRALVHAARGDADAVIRIMEERAIEWSDASFASQFLYDDDMLGPLLRGEAMARVREKYPEATGDE